MQLEAAPHLILQKYLYDNYPDDGSISPRRSEIRWGEKFSGEGDISLIIEGGIPDSKFINTGRTLKSNKQSVTLTIELRDSTGVYPIQIYNMRKWICDFIRKNHSSDYLDTWNIAYVVVRRMNTQRLPSDSQLADMYRLRMLIDMIYMTELNL